MLFNSCTCLRSPLFPAIIPYHSLESKPTKLQSPSLPSRSSSFAIDSAGASPCETSSLSQLAYETSPRGNHDSLRAESLVCCAGTSQILRSGGCCPRPSLQIQSGLSLSKHSKTPSPEKNPRSILHHTRTAPVSISSTSYHTTTIAPLHPSPGATRIPPTTRRLLVPPRRRIIWRLAPKALRSRRLVLAAEHAPDRCMVSRGNYPSVARAAPLLCRDALPSAELPFARVISRCNVM